jgi:hypothetical protein
VLVAHRPRVERRSGRQSEALSWRAGAAASETIQASCMRGLGAADAEEVGVLGSPLLAVVSSKRRNLEQI